MATSSILKLIFSLLILNQIIALNARSVTYDHIGTFTDHDFYDEQWRPLVMIPESPEQINPEFMLFTPDNLDHHDDLLWNDPAEYDKTHFNPKLQTKVLVHGFIDNPKIGPWMLRMKNEFLQVGDFNVIIVDWGKGNFFPYTLATANTRVVGAMLGVLIENLCQHFKIQPNSFHLLGHSLGAHVVGYAGKRMNGTVGHITGFDPAGPYFEGLKDPRARLWHTDAQFVESIHTDARHLIPDFGFGMYDTCSHVDIYPNGGRDQPGCAQERVTKIFTDGLFEGFRRLIACNHQRSVDFYSEAILRTESTPVAYICDDFESFKEGKCVSCGKNGTNCAIVGPKTIDYKKFIADPTKTQGKRFFMVTGSHSEFFRYQYLIRIKLQEQQNSHEHFGRIKIKLMTAHGDQEVEFTEHEQTFVHGQEYTRVLVADVDPTTLTSLEVHWSHRLDVVYSSLFIENVEIKPLSAHTGLRNFDVFKFEPENHEVPNRHGVIFKRA